MKSFDEIMTLTSTVSNSSILQLDECRAMYDTLCELPDCAAIVEVGCDYGRSSSLILQVAKERNFSTIHIDPWQWHPDRAKEWMAVMCERCEYHPFVLLKMTTERAQWFLPGGVSFAFIDGSHDQPLVELDLEVVAGRVILGGFLVAHDYPSAGVSDVIDAYVAKGGWSKHRQAGGLGVWRRL